MESTRFYLLRKSAFSNFENFTIFSQFSKFDKPILSETPYGLSSQPADLSSDPFKDFETFKSDH